MRAWVCEALTGRDGLRLRENWLEPMAGRGQVVVAVRAAALNFPDLLMLEGRYQHRAEPPYVPGLEAAGEVIACGPGVDPAWLQRRVILAARGTLAERVVVGLEDIVPMPAAWSFSTAAAFRVVGVTAYHALVQRTRLRAAETLLVNGASGGTGHMAVKLGKALGARVIATTSDPAKSGAIRGFGADAVVELADADVVGAIKRAAGGRGVDVVFDPVGGAAFEAALKASGFGARIAVVGFTSGGANSVATNYALIKGLSILGIRAGEAARQDATIAHAYRTDLMDLAGTHDLRPHVGSIVPFADARTAFDALADRRVIGKVVVAI
jgi:NADPH2:quinone reductase